MNNLGLARFIKAQNNVYETALEEIKTGKKKSHWMWFIFPQLRGLGKTSMAYFYGIVDIDEAKAYLEHPVLRKRLNECCETFLLHKGKDAEDILGHIDAMKLRSSMTLFALASEENSVFHRVLDGFYDGKKDINTLSKISKLKGE